MGSYLSMLKSEDLLPLQYLYIVKMVNLGQIFMSSPRPYNIQIC